MKNFDPIVRFSFWVAFVVTTASCTDSQITPNNNSLTPLRKGGDIFGRPGRELPEGIPENDDWRYPYPDIISREFIPPYEPFANTKCLAWRITWPSYDNSADDNKIPTVWGMNGALSSFDYLNSVGPGNTLNKAFSLYYQNKVEVAAMLWAELDHEDILAMEIPEFALSDQPLENIIYWVTERPSFFQIHYPGGGVNELDYDEGDIIQFRLNDAGLYGGIRIVSMTPRIIEVYLAVPNY